MALPDAVEHVVLGRLALRSAPPGPAGAAEGADGQWTEIVDGEARFGVLGQYVSMRSSLASRSGSLNSFEV